LYAGRSDTAIAIHIRERRLPAGFNAATRLLQIAKSRRWEGLQLAFDCALLGVLVFDDFAVSPRRHVAHNHQNYRG
jgi:hypothetical protein